MSEVFKVECGEKVVSCRASLRCSMPKLMKGIESEFPYGGTNCLTYKENWLGARFAHSPCRILGETKARLLLVGEVDNFLQTVSAFGEIKPTTRLLDFFVAHTQGNPELQLKGLPIQQIGTGFAFGDEELVVGLEFEKDHPSLLEVDY